MDDGNSAGEPDFADVLRFPARSHRGQRGGSGWERKRAGRAQGNHSAFRAPGWPERRFELAEKFEPLKADRSVIRSPMGKWFWKGCKPNSVCTLASGENHLSQQPYPESVSLSRNLERAAPGFPIWPCTRWGFPCRVACASRGALLPHLFTLANCSGGL